MKNILEEFYNKIDPNQELNFDTKEELIGRIDPDTCYCTVCKKWINKLKFFLTDICCDCCQISDPKVSLDGVIEVNVIVKRQLEYIEINFTA